MISLRTIHLAPVSDLSDQLVLDVSQSVNIRARTDAQGTRVTLRIESATLATRNKLQKLVAQRLLYRDDKGRLLYGSFPNLRISEQPGLDRCSLSFTFIESGGTAEV